MGNASHGNAQTRNENEMTRRMGKHIYIYTNRHIRTQYFQFYKDKPPSCGTKLVFWVDLSYSLAGFVHVAAKKFPATMIILHFSWSNVWNHFVPSSFSWCGSCIRWCFDSIERHNRFDECVCSKQKNVQRKIFHWSNCWRDQIEWHRLRDRAPKAILADAEGYETEYQFLWV